MARRPRFLGSLDAAIDERFENHFIESPDLTRINDDRLKIVFGSKGVGKTALRRALTEIHKDLFWNTMTVALERMNFSQVYRSLEKLEKTVLEDITTIARNAWKNVLAIYCLEVVADGAGGDPKLKHDINAFLKREAFSGVQGAAPSGRLFALVEKVFAKISELGIDSDKPTPLGLSFKQRNAISEFPLFPEIADLLTRCIQILRNARGKALICLDGFDSIVDHTPEARQAIFAGLVDATFYFVSDREFSSCFCFKLFLPQEFTDTALVRVWDYDKYVNDIHRIKWSESDFQRLLWKRMLFYSRGKSTNFLDVWHEFMPDKIRNEIHKVDETSFGYILRHTLYRPRHLLAHVQAILTEWDGKSDSFRVDPTFVPGVVARTNRELALAVVNQIELICEGMKQFMQSWGGSPSIVSSATFAERLRRQFGYSSSADTAKLFDILYRFGIIGLAKEEALTKPGQFKSFRFDFVEDNFAPGAPDDADWVAISPMLREFCNCKPSDHGAIVPVA